MKLCDVKRTWEKKLKGHLECTSSVCRENKSANAAKN
jgi:hypothetical protein